MPGPKQPVYYATKTNFFVRAKAGTKERGVSAYAVAEAAYAAMMSGKSEITYGFINKILTNFLVRIVPYRVQAALIDKNSEV